MRAEPHLLVVDREVRHAATQLEQVFPRVAVSLVLLLGIGHSLLREAVLQLEGSHW